MSRLARRLLGISGDAYGPVVLADGPYAYWRLDEVSGAVAADSGGNRRHGAYVAPVSLAEHTLLPALPAARYVSMSGPGSGYVDVSAANQFCAGTDWSLECWINVLAFLVLPDNYGCALMSSQTAPGGTTGWTISASESPRGVMTYYTANLVNLGVHCTLPLTLAHFAAVYTGENQTLSAYLDGQFTGTQYGGDALPPLIEAGLYIGAAALGAGTLDGLIGEFAVYDYALTAGQILRHYNAGMGATPANQHD
ncbi:LamG domain-containing protein [Paraburkholderia sp. B3]|uniref:LamG domain-containing protein n=1 Tax=Paraburkholderia sp. B3 TaxID=3134791 RepID=UPI003982B85E